MVELDKNEGEGPFEFKVNGVQLEAKTRYLVALEILQLAADRGAMPGKPDEYALQGDKRLYGPDDKVDLAEDNQFITIPTTPTDVA